MTGLDGTREKLPLAHKMILPGELLERPGPHPLGQRRGDGAAREVFVVFDLAHCSTVDSLSVRASQGLILAHVGGIACAFIVNQIKAVQ